MTLTSRQSTYHNREESNERSKGFTLLELLLSLSIISLVLLVLYQAFSVGFRVWEGDQERSGKMFRLEAVLKLLEEDMLQAVPYNMNWKEGEILLFAGGPRSIYYVTGNGTGAISGPDAGLFFSVLYSDSCPDGHGECLFLHKNPRPAKEFVEAVHGFRVTPAPRGHYDAGKHLRDEGIIALENVADINFYYIAEEFVPFAGRQGMQELEPLYEKDLQPEEEWVLNQLPGQIRISFVLDEEKYFVHVQVGNAR